MVCLENCPMFPPIVSVIKIADSFIYFSHLAGMHSSRSILSHGKCLVVLLLGVVGAFT